MIRLNTFRRIFTAIIALVLVLTCTLGAFAQKRFIYFKDVSRGDWFYGDVLKMVDCGYFQGTSRAMFRPNDSVTRGMFVTVLGRVFGLDTKYYQGKSFFTDTPIKEWYTPYVNWAYEYKITEGTTRTRFSPNSAITREQMAVLLFRSCREMDLGLHISSNYISRFADEKKVSSWAISAVELMRKSSIIRGDQNQRFNPKKLATRAEATAIFSRFMDATKLKKKSSGKYLPDTPVIAHAGGMAGDIKESNSLEAVLQTYMAGVRVIEIDFNFTSDGELACIHDWDKKFAPQITMGVPMSLQDFLSCKIFKKLTPMWLGTIAELLYMYDDLYIVTDVKDDNVAAAKLIKKQYPQLMDRFIIQVYSEWEYREIRKLGYDQMIFSLYKLSWQEKNDMAHLAEFAQNNDILGYTFSYELCSQPQYLSKLLNANVPLFVHTINKKSEQSNYYKSGVYGVYTDSLVK